MAEINERVILRDTAEKYSEKVKEIVPPFVDLMKAIVELEDSAFEKLEEQDAEKEKMGIPSSQVHPEFLDFMEEYREQYGALVSEHCTEKLLDRPYGGSIGRPAKYLDVVNGPLYFTMKSANKAIIETENPKSSPEKLRFVLKNLDGVWKIDEVKYGFLDEDTWYIDEI